ncbi:MAG: hypothetical protein GY713_14140 [Actinomycetia bacterium]|nr:hypothetical protein [Actinomycetes bacterium]
MAGPSGSLGAVGFGLFGKLCPEAEDDLFQTGSSPDDGDSDDGPGDENGSDDESDDGGSSGGSGDFQTVFGLPPGDSVETGWAPYVRNETGFGVDESVVFEVRGATVEEIIAFYQETLPAMGYVVDDPIDLGGTIALNTSDPASPGTTGG